mgnify:CR=1 FL=1
MRITEAMRKTMAWEMIEEISTHAESLDPKRDWKESQEAVCDIYKIAHSIRSPGCRKNHPDWSDKIDAAIRNSKP